MLEGKPGVGMVEATSGLRRESHPLVKVRCWTHAVGDRWARGHCSHVS